jgi:MoxR-like ATPase
MSSPKEVIDSVLKNIETVVIGKTEVLKQLLCCWIAGGHALIEDVPGTGKTIMARALGKSLNVDFKRVQFTPDLLPNDILGFSIFEQKSNQFRFMEGPIFTSVLLGDEINRATPRTQSALLEAMAEGQVSIEGKTHKLDPLFFVVATQNPIEHQGTFPLPEAQLDRFLMKLSLGYLDRQQEIQLAKSHNDKHPIHKLEPIQDGKVILQIRDLLPQVKITDEVYDYAMRIIESTRKHSDIKIGASPRAFLALIRASQAMALIEGKPFVSPAQIHKLTSPILHHRLALNGEAKLQGRTADDVIKNILDSIKVPTR